MKSGARTPMTPERIAVIGLGYVGLPVALAFARRFPGTIGFDIDPARIAALRQGHDVTGEVEPADLAGSGLVVTADPADLAGAGFFIATVPTPIDCRAPAGFRAAAARLRDHRPGADPRRRGGVRIHRLSRRHRGGLRPGPGPRLRPQARHRLRPGLFAGADQPRRPRAPAGAHRQGRVGPGRGDAGAGGGGLWRHRPGRPAPGAVDPRRRGGQGDREHPARPQHRADERAGDDLRPAGPAHRRCAGRRRHQMELPEVPARPGRRPLHRRRSLLPDRQGRGGGLPAGDDPRRPPHQRPDGRLPGGQAGQGAGAPGPHHPAAPGSASWA